MRTGDEQFVVVAPIGRDGELICAQLRRAGFNALCWQNAGAAINHSREGVAGVIVTEEALDPHSLQLWRHFVERQPAWSDLPFIVLTSGALEARSMAHVAKVREVLGNVTILDRPVRVEMLISAVNACMRARRRQYEIRDHLERSNAANEALRESEKLAVAGRLAASIAHEINNPLEGIMNLIFLIGGTDDLESVKKYARAAETELQRVSEIVNQTLRFHRMPAAPATTDLTSLITSALALFKARLRERNIELEKDLRDATAFCSAGEIRQALVNLISNALDSMPDGGRLTVRVRKVTHPVSGERGVRVSIRDTGGGIRDNVRRSLFQQFFTTKGKVGTGLGLWLTKDIVQRNRGSIRFRSRVKSPSGTVFSVWLPHKAATDVVDDRQPQAGKCGENFVTPRTKAG